MWRFARDDYVFRGRTGGRKKRSPSPPIAELQLTGIAKDLHELLKETGIWDMPTAPHKFEYVFGVRLHEKNVRPLVDHGAQTPRPDDPTRVLPVDPHSLWLGFSVPLDPPGPGAPRPLRSLPRPCAAGWSTEGAHSRHRRLEATGAVNVAIPPGLWFQTSRKLGG